MSHHRNARLNEQFKREISHILSQKVRDPRIGPVVVTEVRVTADLWLARVFFRPTGEEASLKETLKGLEAAGPFIRRELGKVLRIRRIPELRFAHDTTVDSAQRIEEVLREILPDDGGAGKESAGEGAGERPGEGVGGSGADVANGVGHAEADDVAEDEAREAPEGRE